jgi:uncharacterized membrane protein YbhN (UPF0104 family)
MNGALGALVDALAQVDPRWVVFALAFQLGNLVLRSTAWRNVLVAAFPGIRFGLGPVVRAYAVGVGLNGWLPARAGDAAKVALVRAEHPGTNAVAIVSSCGVLVAVDSLIGAGLLSAAALGGAIAIRVPQVDLGAVTGAPAVLAAAVVIAIVVAVALGRAFAPRVRSALQHARQGVAVLGSPGRWARTVLTAQLAAWGCRIAVVYCMLGAFGIAPTVQLAALVVVTCGMSTLVPVPGGAGTQQALAVVALAGVAPASQAIAFSLGMQLGVTAVNSTIGLVAAMWSFGHLHPARAVRAALASARPAAARAATAVEPLPDPVS